MTGFNLPQNFMQNRESLLRRVRPRVLPPQHTLSASEPVISAPAASNSMAQKTLRDFSNLSTNNVPIGPDVNWGREFQDQDGLNYDGAGQPFQWQGQ